MQDYYEVLQVSPSADPEVIDAAYKRLALKHHPDRNGDPLVMRALNEAHETLSDLLRRRAYDRKRERSKAGRRSPSQTKNDAPPAWEQSAAPGGGGAAEQAMPPPDAPSLRQRTGLLAAALVAALLTLFFVVIFLLARKTVSTALPPIPGDKSTDSRGIEPKTPSDKQYLSERMAIPGQGRPLKADNRQSGNNQRTEETGPVQGDSQKQTNPKPSHADSPNAKVEPKVSVLPALRTKVALNAPYPQNNPQAPKDKISVQYAVMELLRQAGAQYDFKRSQANVGQLARRWITPKLSDVPCVEAMGKILEPLGLSYELQLGKVVLKRKLLLSEALRKKVTLKPPFPPRNEGAPKRLTVDHAISDLLSQVGIGYDSEKSQANVGKLVIRWVSPVLVDVPCDEALQKVLGPLGLTYELQGNDVVLKGSEYASWNGFATTGENMLNLQDLAKGPTHLSNSTLCIGQRLEKTTGSTKWGGTCFRGPQLMV